MAGTVSTDEVLVVSIAPKKADGSPGEIDAQSVVVASSDETKITIIDLNATNTQIDCKVNTVMPTAEGQPAMFTIQADADLGAGIHIITGFGEVNVTPGASSMAVTFEVTYGATAPKAPTITPL